MKLLGRGKDGGLIVEMSEEESKVLHQLERAVRGEPSWNFNILERPWICSDEDFSAALCAVESFTEAAFRVNDLEQIVKGLRQVVYGKSESGAADHQTG